jgi:acyl dehydratase
MPLVQANTESKLWEEVVRGECLPVLRFPITVKTLVLAVCGTRDLMPYHHNPEYSKSIGNRGMFVNTMFEQALFARFVTDWCGPESDFRSTSLQMVGQLVPDDVAEIRGQVTKKYWDGNDCIVELELTASNEIGVAARSSATIAMPSDQYGGVKPFLSLGKPDIAVNPGIPDEAKEYLGKVSDPAWGAYPISEVQIMYWCDMVEDANPLYEDGEYAGKCRHKGVIAPPMGLISWMMGRAGRTGADASAPDVDCPERKPWPPLPASSSGRPGMFTPPGATDTIATRSVQYYGTPLRPGDRIYSTGELLDCSPLKRTALGPGYFQTNLSTYYNQNDEVVGTNLFTLLRYGVPEPESNEAVPSPSESR